MIHQLNFEGKDKVQVAIERIQDFAKIFSKDAEQGFYLAFSGGKDSCVCKALLDMAGVKYDAHYSVTTVDPPELVRFIKKYHPDVIWERRYWENDGKFHKAGDQITMLNLIPEKGMPPTRLARYCCAMLKEAGGDGRLTVTGVRKAESVARSKTQGVITVYNLPKRERERVTASGNFMETQKGGVVLTNDNDESRKVIEQCYTRHKTVLNPIIDWDDSEVWEFIHEYNVPYCKLYNQGYKRLGCIGCPMSTNSAEELKKYAGFKRLYLNAFGKMISGYRDNPNGWKTPEEVMKWWLRQEVD